MGVSVIIPCYNVEDTIGKQLSALSKQEFEHSWELIIVDNRCTDDTVEVVNNYADKFDNLKIVTADKKAGAAYARNVGVDNSTHNYILFCDADDVVGDQWLTNMAEAFLKHDFIACKWNLKSLNKNNESFHRPRKGGQTKGLMKFSIVRYLPHASGGSIGIKKSIHYSIGGFDENFKFLQDTDYCWRVQLKEIKLHFVSNAVIHTRFRESKTKEFIQSMNWAEYNIKLYKKFSSRGMPEYSLKKSIYRLYCRIKNCRKLIFSDLRANCLWHVAALLGCLKGSLKHRVFVVY